MSNLLKLHVPSVTDPTMFLIKDVSFWDCETTVNNIILEIKVPGGDCFSRFDVQKEFFNSYHCGHLGLCCLGCGSPYSDLPDGVWELKYSYNPNTSTMVYFKHLRTTTLYISYIQAICELQSNRCSLTKREIEEQEKNLFAIRNIIDHAKWMVEECGDENSGLKLYAEAQSKLKQYNECGC